MSHMEADFILRQFLASLPTEPPVAETRPRQSLEAPRQAGYPAKSRPLLNAFATLEPTCQ